MNTTVVISVLASLFIGSHSVLGRVLHRIFIHIEQGKGVLLCVKHFNIVLKIHLKVNTFECICFTGPLSKNYNCCCT